MWKYILKRANRLRPLQRKHTNTNIQARKETQLTHGNPRNTGRKLRTSRKRVHIQTHMHAHKP